MDYVSIVGNVFQTALEDRSRGGDTFRVEIDGSLLTYWIGKIHTSILNILHRNGDVLNTF